MPRIAAGRKTLLWGKTGPGRRRLARERGDGNRCGGKLLNFRRN